MDRATSLSRVGRRAAGACLLLALGSSSGAARADDWVAIGSFTGRTPTALRGEGFDGGRRLYAAIEDEGVYRTEDDGATWVTVNEGLNDRRVSSLAIQHIFPPSPTGCPPPCYGPGVVYASTRGSGVFVLRNDRWAANNSGLTDLDVTVLASGSNGVWAGTAAGRIFRNVFSYFDPQTWSSGGSPGDGTAVLSLAVASDETAFCGTEAGLYRSANGGASWSRVQQNGLQSLAGVRAIAVDPSNPFSVFAAGILTCEVCGMPDYPSIVRSTDGGLTWTEASGDIGNSFARSLLTTSGGNLFAGTASGVFRTVDGGSSWQSTGLEGLEVVALEEAPFPFSEAVPLVAGVAGAGLYRAELPILATCRADSTTLCLRGGRFEIRVSWRTIRAGRASGEGQAIPMTFESGAFWFFQPSNVELVVKVLDGGAINGHFWVFWGALTDVGYTITVTDVVTGTQKSYTNPDGRLASGADMESFPQSSGSLARRPLRAEREEPERHNVSPRE